MNKFRYAGLTDRGRVRLRNEDAWVVRPELGLCLVSDGMGGQNAGGLASRMVVEELPHILERQLAGLSSLHSEEAVAHVSQCFVELNAEVVRQSAGQPGRHGMGATVLLLLLRGNEALLAHLGDSRAYRLQSGKLECLTEDHSLAQLLVAMGDLSPVEAQHHPSRSQLMRFAGMPGDAQPAVRKLKLEAGDRLLLCTDGLTNMVREETLLLLLGAEAGPDEICRKLVDAANAAGGRDNITAVVIEIEAVA